MRSSFRTFVTLLVTVTALLTGVTRAGAEVEGNSYTSPHFGYQISWDSAWYVQDEDSEELPDFLSLTNGISLVLVFGSDFNGGRVRPCIASGRGAIQGQEGISNVQVMLDENLQPIESYDDDSGTLALSYTSTFDDGSTGEFVAYINCRILVPGVSDVLMLAYSPLETFGAEQAAIDAVVDRLVIPSAGEIGPVVASGPWRVAVAGARRDDAFDDLELSQKDGKVWIVVALDVSNWGGQDAVFPTGDITLLRADGTEPVKLAPKSTGNAAAALGAEPKDPKAGVSIGVDQTIRIVLAFQAPDGYTDAALKVLTQRVPLNTAQNRTDADLSTLPGVVHPQTLTQVKVESVPDGSHIVISDQGGAASKIALRGVETPVKNECFAKEATARLAKLAGDTIWIETEELNVRTGGVYVWRDKGDGTRRLINQELVSGGYGNATVGAGQGTERFGSWLNVVALDAKAKPAGLWADCTSLHGVAKTDEVAVSPTAKAATVGGVAKATPAAPQGDSSHDGEWQGTTASGDVVAVTIDAGVISDAHAFLDCGEPTLATLNKPVPFTGSSFEIDLIALDGTDVAMSGTFDEIGGLKVSLDTGALGCDPDSLTLELVRV